MHRHRNLGGRSSPATAVSPRTLASFVERRSESVSQCTGSFSLSSSRTGAPECPITRVILVCNKPAPRCQGGGDHPRRITSRRWSHLRTHMLLMEYHLCFTPFPENVHTSIPPPPFDLLQPLWHPLPTALSLYIHLIRPWLSRRKLLLDPCLFTLPFLFPLFFFFFYSTRSRYLFNDIGRRIEGKPTARLLLFKYHGIADREFSISNIFLSVWNER